MVINELKKIMGYLKRGSIFFLSSALSLSCLENNSAHCVFPILLYHHTLPSLKRSSLAQWLPFYQKPKMSYIHLMPEDLRKYFIRSVVMPIFQENAPKAFRIVKKIIKNNDVQLLTYFLSNGLNPALADSNNTTLLMTAILCNAPECAKILMRYPTALINAQNDQGFTALMYAIDTLNYPLAKLLIENKADTFLKNNQKQTVFDIARCIDGEISDKLSIPLLGVSTLLTQGISFDKINLLLQETKKISKKEHRT